MRERDKEIAAKHAVSKIYPYRHKQNFDIAELWMIEGAAASCQTLQAAVGVIAGNPS
jgi:hypothetical protein